MSLLKQTVKSTSLIAASNYVQIAFSIATLFLLLWLLPVDEYGLFVLALTVPITIDGIFLNLGFSPVIISELANFRALGEMGKVRRLFFDYAKLQFLGSILAVLFVLGASMLFAAEFGDGLVALLMISSVIIFTEMLKRLLITYFSSKSSFREQAFIVSGEAISKAFLLLIFVYYFGMGAEGAMISYPLATLLPSLLLAVPFFRELSELKKIQERAGNILKDIIMAHGKYALFSYQIRTIRGNFPIWAIGYLLGADKVALFSAALRFLQPITGLVASLETIATPTMSSLITKSREQAVIFYSKMSKMGFYISAVLAVAAFFIVPLVIDLFFYAKYSGSIPLFRILLISQIIGGLAAGQRGLLFAMREQKILFNVSVLWLALTVLLVPLYAVYFGLEGACIGFVLASGSLIVRAAMISDALGRKLDLRELFLPAKGDIDLMKRILHGVWRRLRRSSRL